MYSKTKIYVTTVVTVLLVTSPSSVFAFRNGPPAGQNGSTASGGASCKACHGNASGAGSVQIIGAPTTYQLGVLYNLTVRIEDSTQAGAGFQISAEDASGTHAGVLSVVDANTQANADWINHTGTGVNNSVSNWSSMGNSAEYDVEWEAPSSDIGPVTFWVAGNAINNNFAPTGDIVYLHNVTANASPLIPTVTEWGLLVMLLLLMTTGTLVIGRRYTTVSTASMK